MNEENMDKTQFVYAWVSGDTRTLNGAVFLDHATAETAARDAQQKIFQATGFSPAFVVLTRQLTVRYTDWEVSTEEDLTEG